MDTDTMATLVHMARADALLVSDSSFSLVAAVLSQGLVLGMEGWKRFAPVARAGIRNPLKLRADGSFDCGRGLRLWRQAAASAGRGAAG